MGKYIVDLSNIPTDSLIEELGKRNVRTELIYSIEDVDIALENINSERDEDDEIKLTDEQKLSIISDLDFDYESGLINDTIEDSIFREIGED